MQKMENDIMSFFCFILLENVWRNLFILLLNSSEWSKKLTLSGSYCKPEIVYCGQTVHMFSFISEYFDVLIIVKQRRNLKVNFHFITTHKVIVKICQEKNNKTTLLRFGVLFRMDFILFYFIALAKVKGELHCKTYSIIKILVLLFSRPD